MGDDRGRQPAPDGSAGRAGGASVLTPPTGIPLVRGGVRRPPGPAVPPQRATAPCRCGHGPDEHRHWRPGSDCGTCGSGACTAYRPERGPLGRLLRGATSDG